MNTISHVYHCKCCGNTSTNKKEFTLFKGVMICTACKNDLSIDENINNNLILKNPNEFILPPNSCNYNPYEDRC